MDYIIKKFCRLEEEPQNDKYLIINTVITLFFMTVINFVLIIKHFKNNIPNDIENKINEQGVIILKVLGKCKELDLKIYDLSESFLEEQEKRHKKDGFYDIDLDEEYVK